MTKECKRITHLTIALGVLVLAIAGYASRDLAVEQWYLWKLKSEDREEQRAAIQKLGEMRSASARRTSANALTGLTPEGAWTPNHPSGAVDLRSSFSRSSWPRTRPLAS